MVGSTADVWPYRCSVLDSDMMRAWFSCPFVLSKCGVKVVASVEVCTKDEQR
jgi:hypothetical protein